MKRKSGRLILLIGLLLLVVLLVGGYLLLSGQQGGGGLGLGAPPTPTPLPVTILVAMTDIPANTFLSIDVLDESFTAKEYAQAQGLPPDVITSKYQIQDLVNRVDLKKDQPLRQAQFIQARLSFKIPEGKRAFPLEVDRYSGVVGEIEKDDSVDVILSGLVEQYFPQQYGQFGLSQECIPATGGCPTYVQLPFPVTEIGEPTSLLTVKTILEDIQVLKVVTLTSEAAPSGGAKPTPTPTAGGLPPGWILILAVNEQQAEILKFALEQGWDVQLLLRRWADHAPETPKTTGITTWVLLDPQGAYLMPVPRLIPHVVPSGAPPEGVIPGVIPVP